PERQPRSRQRRPGGDHGPYRTAPGAPRTAARVRGNPLDRRRGVVGAGRAHRAGDAAARPVEEVRPDRGGRRPGLGACRDAGGKRAAAVRALSRVQARAARRSAGVGEARLRRRRLRPPLRRWRPGARLRFRDAASEAGHRAGAMTLYSSGDGPASAAGSARAASAAGAAAAGEGAGAGAAAPSRVTRQIVLDRSSATISAPRGSTVTPTGRPRAVWFSRSRKPVRKSTGSPAGRPSRNGTNTTL